MSRKARAAPTVLLDANIWRYLADAEAGPGLLRASLQSGTRVLIAPSVVYEALRTQDPRIRQGLIELMTDNRWLRLLPEAFSESREVISEIRRLRPQWLRKKPDVKFLARLKYDWTRPKGGFWDRARFEAAGELGHLHNLNDDEMLQRARSQAREARQYMLRSEFNFDNVNLTKFSSKPTIQIMGWDGDYVDSWRLAALVSFSHALRDRGHAYLDWLSPLVECVKLRGPSWVRFWLYETAPENMPRFWIRWALETTATNVSGSLGRTPYLQSLRKVTDGTPCDSQLATYLVECDHFVSADRALVSMIQKCRSAAPARMAEASSVPVGSEGISAVFGILERVRSTASRPV